MRLSLRPFLPVLAGLLFPAASIPAMEPAGGGSLDAACDCTASERSGLLTLLQPPKARGPLPPPSTVLGRYSFVPMGGVVHRDLSINNLVDLNPAAGLLDAFGGTVTYNGHTGHDIDLVGFAEQDLGVPVFAALDGTVLQTHDGEFDRQTASSAAPANYVILDHGNTHYSFYWHLRKNSVAVNVGENVKAGQQLGLVGSSGNSTQPHLHFETQVDGRVVEPFTGPSRPGQSLWLYQPTFPAPTVIRRMALSDTTLSGWDGKQALTWKAVWNTGTRLFYMPIMLANGPKLGMTRQFRVLRPDNSIAYDSGSSAWNVEYRSSWWWWSFNLSLNVAGTWRVDFLLNGSVAGSLPFTVVTSGTVANRPPAPLPIAFERPAYSPDDVVVCQATAPAIMADPDFNPVSYQWVWRRNGTVVRSITHGGLMDALPRRTGAAGDAISCEVTATDGSLSAAPTTASLVLYEPYANWAARHGLAASAVSTDTDGDGLPDLAEYWLGTSPTTPNALPLATRRPGDGALVLTLPRFGGDPAVTASVESSANLQGWNPAAADASGTVWTAGSAADNARWMRARFSLGSGGPAATVTVAEVLP